MVALKHDDDSVDISVPVELNVQLRLELEIPLLPLEQEQESAFPPCRPRGLYLHRLSDSRLEVCFAAVKYPPELILSLICFTHFLRCVLPRGGEVRVVGIQLGQWPLPPDLLLSPVRLLHFLRRPYFITCGSFSLPWPWAVWEHARWSHSGSPVLHLDNGLDLWLEGHRFWFPLVPYLDRLQRLRLPAGLSRLGLRLFTSLDQDVQFVAVGQLAFFTYPDSSLMLNLHCPPQRVERLVQEWLERQAEHLQKMRTLQNSVWYRYNTVFIFEGDWPAGLVDWLMQRVLEPVASGGPVRLTLREQRLQWGEGEPHWQGNCLILPRKWQSQPVEALSLQGLRWAHGLYRLLKEFYFSN